MESELRTDKGGKRARNARIDEKHEKTYLEEDVEAMNEHEELEQRKIICRKLFNRCFATKNKYMCGCCEFREICDEERTVREELE